MSRDSENKIGKDLNRVIVYSTSISFGGLAAFLFSLRHVRKDPTLIFSSRTVVGFVAGFLAGWIFWWVVKRLNEKKPRPGGSSAPFSKMRARFKSRRGDATDR